jgi:hypothetical protein
VCLYIFISFLQGGKGDLGLLGLPGPAGLVGQNGDRVRNIKGTTKAEAEIHV